jgi:hypothetical protein
VDCASGRIPSSLVLSTVMILRTPPGRATSFPAVMSDWHDHCLRRPSKDPIAAWL